MTNIIATPFANLSPDVILDALESLGIKCDGRLFALNSYENRVYQIGIEDEPPVVAKFYRPNRWNCESIQEEHDFVFSLSELEIPVVPPLKFRGQSIHNYDGFQFAIYKKLGGRAPELDKAGTLEWIGRFLGRIHACGAASKFMHRPRLTIEDFGVLPAEYLLENFIPVDIKLSFKSVVNMTIDAVRGCFERTRNLENIRLHGDCHSGNLIWTDDGPHFVDFDDSMMGPAIQDFWMLLSGNPDEMKLQLHELLSGYENFCEFNDSELNLIEALRSLRLIYYSYWLAKRWSDPAFPKAFPWFNTQQYWQNMILQLREQVAAMSEPPLWQGNC